MDTLVSRLRSCIHTSTYPIGMMLEETAARIDALERALRCTAIQHQQSAIGSDMWVCVHCGNWVDREYDVENFKHRESCITRPAALSGTVAPAQPTGATRLSLDRSSP